MSTAAENQLNSTQRQLSSARSNMNSARNSLSSAQAKADRYRRRKAQVERVRNALKSKFDWQVNAIRDNQNHLAINLANGSAGLRHESALTSFLHNDKEKAAENDSLGSQIYNNLSQEIARCQQAIENANSEASSCKRLINSYESNIAALNNEAKMLQIEIANQQ